MIISNFEVQVTSPEGVPFHEVLDPHTGEIYVVAEAGKRFELRYRTSSQYYNPSANLYMVRSRIDDKCVGTGIILYPGRAGDKHIGFMRHGDTHGITYDLFKFASAAADDAVMAESIEFKQGRMEVTVQAVREMPGTNNVNVAGASSKASKVPSLPEGKKFFLAPSLTTASAGVQSDPRGFNNRRYADAGLPATIFAFRYETASTLLLRKILRRENPVHAAILDSFPETRICFAHTQPDSSTMASSAPGQQQHPRVKRERAIKTEVVDLVGPGRSIQIAENLAPNEELECDLTGGDEDVPQWTKRRKPGT